MNRAEQFLAGIALSLSPNTFSKYRDALGGLETRFPDVSKVKTADVLAWIEAEKAAGVKNITVRSKLGLLMRFFRWLQDTGAIQSQPLWHTLPKLPKGRPHKIAFSEEQFRRVLNIAGNHPWYLETACVIGWHTGLRLSDVCLLRRENINLDDGIIRVVPEKKKRFEQFIEIPIAPELREHLLKVWNTQPATDFACMELAGYYRNYRTTLQNMLRAMFDDAGLPGHGFHGMRRGFISRLVNGGVETAVVQSMTGQSLAVLVGYLTISPETKRRALGINLQTTETSTMKAAI